jgi:hypothetical protein
MPTGTETAIAHGAAVTGVCRIRPNSLCMSPYGGGLSIVSTELIAGVFTALGALIAAGATFTSGLMGNRTQKALATASRQTQIVEVRRDAYAAYLTAVYRFMDCARELIAKLEAHAEMSECKAAHRTYMDRWDNLHPTYAPVLIAGPGEIEKSAEVLRFCLGDLADKCDSWYAAHEAGKKPRQVDGLVNAQQAARDARLKFSEAARRHLYG